MMTSDKIIFNDEYKVNSNAREYVRIPVSKRNNAKMVNLGGGHVTMWRLHQKS